MKLYKNAFKRIALLMVTILTFSLASVRAQESSKDIVETAVAAGQFTTLAKALDAAGLIETLKGNGPFTVFAPTDSAFAKLPDGTVEGLLKDIPKLKKILMYHVVAGKLMASDVLKKKNLKTLEGGKVKISTKNGVKVNNAAITATDIAASNGVIHIIDTVLLPKK
jgi:uncharacterized surface protein with fasciclin (FAS1) repeats